MSDLPLISVIIPVYRDPRGLDRCLRALAVQSYPRERFEVLVVDNDPVPHRSPYDAAIAAFPGRVRLLQEKAPGSYAARNRALRDATGDLLAFTDADCVPSPSWLAEGAARWRARSPASIIGGPMEILYPNGKRSVAEQYDRLFLGFPQKSFVDDHFAATGNMMCGRAVFERAGPFNASLFSAGDYEWGRRAYARGIEVHYEPTVVVAHPARASLPAIFRKVRRLTGGVWMVMLRSDGSRSLRDRLVIERDRFRWSREVLRADRQIPPAQRGALFLLAGFFYAVRVGELVRLAAGGRPSRN